jgi:predicted DCC family thiol-disulfide oxidoreductase YuxK
MEVLKRFWNARVLPAFALDLRSLALFRAALALVLIWDDLSRCGDLRVFYTDAGLMPRPWLTQIGDPFRVSLHLASGDAWFQALLLAAQLLAAFCLFWGWRTRAATAVAWILGVSIAVRNPVVLTAADVLLNSLLFWCLFLPLHARWSADAALSSTPSPSEPHRSWASAGLVLQILSVYFFGALFKSGPEWWPAGTAINEALALSTFAYPWSALLLEVPGLTRSLSWWVWGLEWLGPLLVLSPILNRRLRRFALVNFAALNLGLILFFASGALPWVCLAALPALLGSSLWDSLAARRARQHPGAPLRIYYDGDCAFCRKSSRLLREALLLPESLLAPASDSARAQTLMQAHHSWVVIDHDDTAHLKWAAFVALVRHSPVFWPLSGLLRLRPVSALGLRAYEHIAQHRKTVATMFERWLPEREVVFSTPAWTRYPAAAALFAILLWNLASVGAAPAFAQRLLTPPMFLLGLDQAWSGFSSFPRSDDGWFVAAGEKADGGQIDLLSTDHAAPDYSSPRWLSLKSGNARWTAYQRRLLDSRHEGERRQWARYLCREWNQGRAANDPERLSELRLVYLLRPAAGSAPSAGEQRILWRGSCGETLVP